ncbi:hypothetical protein K8B83_18965 [Shewanella inventionis]|uniref:endonuclease domain-containing protein n=1 Tax=Shewanella inventionis TaxID=1738770 RepID=UPI001CC187BB|nr:endonuclease domain-containing protein [Shewanella inventionis]UAL42874.1 hypothetical protein K8B83_18965 [Shewanella inventionis]
MNNKNNNKNKQKLILNQKELAELRANAKCHFCKTDSDLVVDHDHTTHHIREVLCRLCNGAFLLGGIENRLNTLAKRTGLTLADAIKMISDYLTNDYSMNHYYTNMLAVEAKRFARLNAGEQREQLALYNVDTTALTNNKQRLTAFKQALKLIHKRKK